MASREPVKWITIKGNRIPIFEDEDALDAVDRFFNEKHDADTKDKTIKANKDEADRLNDNEKDLDISKRLSQKQYKGIWYGAKNKPITVKEMLDKIIKDEGRGFTVKVQFKASSDNLLESGETIKYLSDEEGRGKFRLDSDSIKYLMNTLSEDNWLRKKLSK